MKRARSHRNIILSAILCLALALIIGGCGDSGSNNNRAAGPTGDNVAFVLTTDYSTGSYSTIELDTLTANKNLPGQAGIVESDNAGAYFNGRIYIINRGTPSNITVVDRADPAAALNQFSTGDSTNPYAMAFNSDTEAYVCLYAKNEILVVDPTVTSDQITSTIDLSGFTAAGDPDGIVEASTMLKVNDYLFVALQRLNRNNFFAVENDALLVVVDTTTNTVVDTDVSTPNVVDAITLTGRNPQFMFYDETSGKIFVTETGSYGVNDGGVETVDPTAFEAEGFIIDESELGGDLGAVAVSNGTGYVVVAGTYPNNTIMTFDASDGTKGDDLLVNGAFIPSLTLDDQGRLFVPDRTTTAPGVRIYDTADNTEITTGVIDVGLPPNVILVY
jgi:hypothetical protein